MLTTSSVWQPICNLSNNDLHAFLIFFSFFKGRRCAMLFVAEGGLNHERLLP